MRIPLTAPRRSSLVRWLVPGLLFGATGAYALELGFEARALYEASDNFRQADTGEEEDASFGFASIGVFGEQLGTFASGGFRGEIDARKRLDDSDDDVDTITSFLGAVEFQLTPRVLSWYVGDVLGSVRADDADQPATDFQTRRRNVFVTGPQVEWQIDVANRLDARLLYVNQSEDGDELETLYNGFVEYTRERVAGRRIGVRASDVYIDASALDDQDDVNRVSGSLFLERERGFWTVSAEAGATRYDEGDQIVDGSLLEFGVLRQLGPISTVGLTLGRDLSDQTLGTVTGLLADGAASQQDVAGIFQRTRAELVYALTAASVSFNAGAGIAELDYQTVDVGLADDQDQTETYAFADLSRSFGARWRLQAGARFEQERFDNVPDRTDSLLGFVGAVYRLSRSLELEANYLFDQLDGRQTDAGGVLGDVERTENRAGIGLRWAPPTRASQDLTVELKSLIR